MRRHWERATGHAPRNYPSPGPSLEKHHSSSANLWWRKFVQYIKMTKEIDLSTETNSKEVLPQYREQLGLETKDTILREIRQVHWQKWQKQSANGNPVLYRYINYTLPAATTTRRTRTIFKTDTVHPDGRRRKWFREGPKPVSLRSSSNQLGQIRGRQKRPIHGNGPCTESGRRRA